MTAYCQDLKISQSAFAPRHAGGFVQIKQFSHSVSFFVGAQRQVTFESEARQVGFAPKPLQYSVQSARSSLSQPEAAAAKAVRRLASAKYKSRRLTAVFTHSHLSSREGIGEVCGLSVHVTRWR